MEEPKWGRSGGVQIESCRGCFYTTITSDANRMWNTLARIIKDATGEALGVVIGISKTHKTCRESWWLSEEVRAKLAVKQTRSRELLSCQEGNQEDRLRAHERIAKARERRRKDLGDISFRKDERAKRTAVIRLSRISQAKVRTALHEMGRNKPVGPDQILIKAWRGLGDEGDAQVCNNYMDIKLLGHTMKLCKIVIERRLQRETTVSEN
nr:hypothetical protein [Tanacetum cinerariifolium]GFA63845.1 hypothetical protein [Tanacetum cinerariifolium]